MGMEEEVPLYFLVTGHTKNICDGAFGHVKLTLQRADAVVRSDMMTVLENSASSKSYVAGSKVTWCTIGSCFWESSP